MAIPVVTIETPFKKIGTVRPGSINRFDINYTSGTDPVVSAIVVENAVVSAEAVSGTITFTFKAPPKRLRRYDKRRRIIQDVQIIFADESAPEDTAIETITFRAEF